MLLCCLSIQEFDHVLGFINSSITLTIAPLLAISLNHNTNNESKGQTLGLFTFSVLWLHVVKQKTFLNLNGTSDTRDLMKRKA